MPVGRPWQEPDEVSGAAGPTCIATIDTEGRTGDRRGDFDSVYGDWAEVAAHVRGRRRRARRPTCWPGSSWPPRTRPRCC